MTSPNPNGTPNGFRVPTWALMLLVPPVLGVVIGWVTTTNTRMSAHGEHLAVIQAQLKDTREELQRINTKLDRLLERSALRP
jgi:hypothetical protein